LVRIIHNLHQIDYLSDAGDALDTFDGDLSQVKRRNSALNHRDALLDADLQCPMRSVAPMDERIFHSQNQIVVCFSEIRMFV